MAEKEALHTKVDRRSQWPGAAARRHVRTSRPYYAHQPVVERQRSVEPPALSGRRQDLSPCLAALRLASWSMSLPAAIIVEGVPWQRPAAAYRARTDARPTATAGGDRATRGNVGARIRRDLSLRKGSAREPQRLPRRRFPLSTPRIVASLMVAPASLAVRCFRPPVACDDRPATTLTADDVRVDDEMVPDPLVDSLDLVTDGGDASRIDLVEKVVHLNAPGSSPPRQRRTWRRRHPPCRDGAAAALCGRALELAAKEARARSPR